MEYTNEAIKKRKEKKQKIKNKIKIIAYIILIPMLIYNITLIFQAIIKPNETPSFLGIKMYVIISGSMQPELDIGDIVVVKNVEKNELKEGDIISFRKGQTVVTHRITEVLEQGNEIQFKTKGDNNNVEDLDKVKEKDVEGKVVQKISYLGNIVLLLSDKTWIITIVLFYYVYLVHDQSIQKRKILRRMKREEHEKKKRGEWIWGIINIKLKLII